MSGSPPTATRGLRQASVPSEPPSHAPPGVSLLGVHDPILSNGGGSGEQLRYLTGRFTCAILQPTRALSHTLSPMSANTIQARWRPRDPMSATAAEQKAVTLTTTSPPCTEPRPRTIRTPARPHQATVVRCQANRRVCFVNSSEPKRCGRSGRRNNRRRIYRSPSTEWASPSSRRSSAATASQGLPRPCIGSLSDISMVSAYRSASAAARGVVRCLHVLVRQRFGSQTSHEQRTLGPSKECFPPSCRRTLQSSNVIIAGRT